MKTLTFILLAVFCVIAVSAQPAPPIVRNRFTTNSDAKIPKLGAAAATTTNAGFLLIEGSRITMAEAAIVPGTPASGFGVIYFKADGRLYTKDDTGAEVDLSSGSPTGADTQIQFNDGGAFGADAGLTYNKATDSLTVAGTVGAGALTASTLQTTEGVTVGSDLIATSGDTSLAHTRPAATISYDLGSASLYWRTGYIESVVSSNLTVNGPMVVDSLVTPLLVVTSNVNEFAAGAYHGIDLNVGSEFVGTNSLAGNTILSYTNFYKWTNNAFSVRLEGAAAGGSDHIVTNIFAGAIGSVPTLVQVNGGANTVSPLVLTTTNGTTLEMNGKVFFSRGTNFIDLLVKWGTR